MKTVSLDVAAIGAAAEHVALTSQRILDIVAAQTPAAFRAIPKGYMDAYFDAKRALHQAKHDAALAAQAVTTTPPQRHTLRIALSTASDALHIADTIINRAIDGAESEHPEADRDAYITARELARTSIERARAMINNDAYDAAAQRHAEDEIRAPRSSLITRTLPNGFTFPVAHEATPSFGPDPVEAEHGIDPDEAEHGFRMGTTPREPGHTTSDADWTTTLQKGRETSATKHTYRMPDRVTLTDVTVHHHPTRPASATATGTVVDIVDPDLITIDRKHALALIGGALVLAKDLLKRNHPRNAARYRDAAVALTEALALPPLADDPQEES